MDRQAINVSIKELKILIKELQKEEKELEEEIGLKIHKEKKWLIPIINYPTITKDKYFYASDTWQFEKLEVKE